MHKVLPTDDTTFCHLLFVVKSLSLDCVDVDLRVDTISVIVAQLVWSIDVKASKAIFNPRLVLMKEYFFDIISTTITSPKKWSQDVQLNYTERYSEHSTDNDRKLGALFKAHPCDLYRVGRKACLSTWYLHFRGTAKMGACKKFSLRFSYVSFFFDPFA